MPRVALFVTCVVDAFAPDAGVATVKLLRAAGRTVEVPDGQTCCGQPAANAGFAADAARVAATTLEALDGALVAGAEAVVVPSGSCTTMIRRFWADLFRQVGDSERAERALAVAAHTFELTEWLAGPAAGALPALVHPPVDPRREPRPPDPAATGDGSRRDVHDGSGDQGGRSSDPDGGRGGEPTSVAWHRGCHLHRELGVTDAPGDLLASVPGCRVVDWPDEERCCGFGGSFSVKLPEVAEAMADQKLASLPRSDDGTPVEIVSTDASCLLHLRARAEATGVPVRVRHVAEVAAAALPPPA